MTGGSDDFGTEDPQEKDIVDCLSEATGYFHDSDAAKLRDIASESGQKPVGVVRAAVEKEIENREWRCVNFEHSEGDEYPAANPYEYYRIHKRLQKQYENAISELSYEDPPYGEKSQDGFEPAVEALEKKARVHRAKAETAERYLEENGEDPEEVLMSS